MKQQKNNQFFRTVFAIFIIAMLVFSPQATAFAVTTLTVTPITWNVIGLDSNNVNVGPNHFPIGARICNTGAAIATNVVATFNWDSANGLINLRAGTADPSLPAIASLAIGACTDAYFEVEVTRTAAAYDTTRQYHISVSADAGATTGSTPTIRELYVEHLVSQARNQITDMQLAPDSAGVPGTYVSFSAGSTMTLAVGGTYWIKLVGNTATNGYEQIESFINFPNTIFQVLSVGTVASVPYPDTSKLYADACTWVNDINNPNYRSCVSTGKSGGNIAVSYQIKILQIPGAPLVNPQPLSTLIYDFSGSSYHYNADFSSTVRYAKIVTADITKSFAPNEIKPDENSTMTFKITNPTSSTITNVNFTDNLATATMRLSASPTVAYDSGCTGTPSPAAGALTGGATSLSFSGISIVSGGTCTITVTYVTATSNGSHVNTTGNLFINSTVDTGRTGTDTLTVSSNPVGPTSCTTYTTLATWTMTGLAAGSTTGPAYDAGTKPANVSVATSLAGLTTGTSTINAVEGNAVPSWLIDDDWFTTAPTTTSGAPYFMFKVDTSNYGAARITFDHQLLPANNWTAANALWLFTSTNNGSSWTQAGTGTIDKGWQTMVKNVNLPIAAATTGLAETWFKIQFTTAGATSVEAYLDNITVSACPRPTAPTIAKAFSTSPIAKDSSSTLTFTFKNTNAVGVSLTGVNFTDKLPLGLEVANPNGLSAVSCTGGAISLQTITATAGSRDISLSGATMTRTSGIETSCSFSVNVKGTVVGSYTNVTSLISANLIVPTSYGTAPLTVIDPPVIAKTFGATSIITGTTTPLTFTITNPNPSVALTGVAFSDTLPAGLDVASNGGVAQCGGTMTTTNLNPAADTIVLTGATIAAGGTCTFSVTVTGTTVGQKDNVTSTVTSTNGGTGNTANAKILVKDLTPKIAIKKQVSTSSTGPWYDSLLASAGTTLYYKFTVENTGNVDFTSFSLSDNTFTPTCTWKRVSDDAVTSTLPNSVTANVDSSAYCIASNTVTAAAGYVINTATVTGNTASSGTANASDKAIYSNGNFGHLPSSYTNMNLYNDGGAINMNGTTYLGVRLPSLGADPAETDGINTAYTPQATDDGIQWTAPWSAINGQATVTATCASGTTRKLYGWFDWNRDSIFNPVGETFNWDVACSPSPTGSTTIINFNPGGLLDLSVNPIYVRFRIYDVAPVNPQPYSATLDATGNPIFGEIEDYKITELSTPVTVSYFLAQPQGDGVSFDWSTATETGNIGFNLYAQAADGTLTKLNEQLIASQDADSLARLDYSFSANSQADTFFIEDVSIFNETRRHGPFLLGQPYGSQVEADKIDQAAINAEHAGKAAEYQSELTGSLSATQSTRSGLTNTLNIKVNKTGIYRVTFEALKNAGLDLGNTSAAKITLTNSGKNVPIFMQLSAKSRSSGKFGSGSYFEFYGKALDTQYTDTNIYTVQVGKSAGARISSNRATPGKGLSVQKLFSDTLTVNNQREYADYTPGADAWYDTSMLAFSTPLTQDFHFTVNSPVDASAVQSFELVVWGVTDWPADIDHHLVANINGVSVADATFNGLVEKVIKVSLPAGTVHQGDNLLQLTLPSDSVGVDWDMINLDKFSVSYQRPFKAVDGQLTFTATGKSFKVTDLPSSKVVVYRLDKKGIVRLGQVKVQGSGATFSASFAGSNQSATYFVSTADALPAPVLEATRVTADLNQPAQYLIISHPDFIAGLQPLVQARQAQGLSVSVVDVNDLYAKYNYGVFDPQAIRNYIAYAKQNLGTQYVLLVGGDTYDYRNYLGVNSISFIPSLYVSTGPSVKFVPADPLFADVNADNIPDLAIGRFPVRTQAELNLMINKTLAYATKDYGKTAVFTSDLIDGSVSFKGISDATKATLPADWAVQDVHLDDLSVATARTQLIAAMNNGTALINFTGHSAPSMWTFSGLFRSSHAAALTNTGKPFVAVQWGCWNNYYVDPLNNNLVQSLLFSGDKGAAALLGASTLTDSESERQLGLLLTPRMTAPGTTIGSALQESKALLAQSHPEMLDVLLGWSLMGDPALVIQP